MSNDDWTAPVDPAAGVISRANYITYAMQNIQAVFNGLVGDASADALVLHRHKRGTLAGIPAPGNAGRLYLTSDEGEVTLIDNGTAWMPDGVQVLDRDLTEEDVENSVVEKTIYSHTVPAGILGTKGGFRLTLGGDAKINVAGTVVFKVKLGGTTVFTSRALDISNSATRYKWQWGILCQNHGVVDSQKWVSTMHAVVETQNFAFQLGDSVNAFHGVGFNASVEDTSGALLLDVTAQWSAAHGDLSWRKEMALLELLPGD